MKKNVGKPDKIFRVIVGLGAVVLATASRDLWYILAAYLLLTAIVGYSPIYAALGKNTIRK